MSRPTKRSLEKRLRRLADESGGTIGDAVEELRLPSDIVPQAREEMAEFDAGDREHFSEHVAAAIRGAAIEQETHTPTPRDTSGRVGE